MSLPIRPIRLANLPRQKKGVTGTGYEKPSLTAARTTIQAIQRLDLRNAKIEALSDRLRMLMGGLVMVPQTLRIGMVMFRGVKWQARPTMLAQLSFPPSNVVKTLQRANRPGDPRFYASIGPNAPFYELRARVGDRIAISAWRAKREGTLNHLGYMPETFERLSSSPRPSGGITQIAPHISYDPVDRIVHRFLAKEFTKEVPPGSEHLYMTSALIAERFLSGIRKGNNSEESFAGLLYPALAMFGNSDNLCLLPDFVTSGLDFLEVDYVQVSKVTNDTSFEVICLDHALNTFGDSTLNWRGPRKAADAPMLCARRQIDFAP